MSWYKINPALMEKVNANDRTPFKVPDNAQSSNGRTRWSEIVTIVGTDYTEMTKDNGDVVGQVKLRLRVSEQYSTDPTNRGKTLSTSKNINYTQLENDGPEAGQVQMSAISLRQLTSLLLATGVIKDRSEIGSMGDYFAAGNSKVNGATVIAQVEQSLDKRGEAQQEPARFAPFQIQGR